MTVAHTNRGAISTSAPYDARQVANYVLDRLEAAGVRVTLLKLLKLLYFLYGTYYAHRHARLFHNPFEAWKHGPVVRAVWSEFGGQGAREVTSRATYLDLNTGERSLAPARLAPDDESDLWDFLRGYIGHGAWELSDMTHEPDTPWHRAWHSAGSSANLGMRISDEAIRDYFTNGVNSSIRS